MIKSVSSYLSSEHGQLYKVDDLTKYIDISGVQFTEEEVEFTRNNVFQDEPSGNEQIFDFEVLETEEEKGV